MVFYPQSRVIRPGHRLHKRINDLLISHEAIVIATNDLASGSARFDPGDRGSIDCKQLDISVQIPVYGPLEKALADAAQVGSMIQFLPRGSEPYLFNAYAAGFGKAPLSYGFRRAVLDLVTPLLVEFFENYKDWINTRFPGGGSNWPEVWRFGRVVRNSISHGNRINIINSNASPVS
jgi:hypothetical protein